MRSYVKNLTSILMMALGLAIERLCASPIKGAQSPTSYDDRLTSQS